MSRCHSGVWNQYPTICTFTGVLYGLLAVVLYIHHIYYNNTLFALFFTMLIFSPCKCMYSTSRWWQIVQFEGVSTLRCVLLYMMFLWLIKSVFKCSLFTYILEIVNISDIRLDSTKTKVAPKIVVKMHTKLYLTSIH